jgi:cytidylate kinase
MLRVASEYVRTRDESHRAQPVGSWWTRFGQTLALGAPEAGPLTVDSDAAYEGELFEIEKRIVREVVEGQIAAESTIIVGRGAAQTLRGRAGVLTVFIHAPQARRVERAQQAHATDRAAAERLIQQADRNRSRFIKAVAAVDWTDSRAYDLSVDSAALGFDAAVDLIARASIARIDRPPQTS